MCRRKGEEIGEWEGDGLYIYRVSFTLGYSKRMIHGKEDPIGGVYYS